MELPKSHDEFEVSLSDPEPPSQWPACLQALWWDARGEWHKAHECVDALTTPEATWVHAYLHRKEGDRWNAEYWYRRAKREYPLVDLEEEFREILLAFLHP